MVSKLGYQIGPRIKLGYHRLYSLCDHVSVYVNPIFLSFCFYRNQDEYEYVFSDEEEEEDNGYYHSQCTEENNLLDDTTCGGEALPFLPTRVTRMDQPGQGMVKPNESLDSDQLSYYSSPPSESEYESEEVAEEEDITGRDSGIVTNEENHDGMLITRLKS